MPELIDLVNYYDSVLSPYRYILTSHNGLTLDFDIKPNEMCHLVFGTIDDKLPKKENYKGLKGYQKLKDGTVTWNNLPHAVKKHSNIRTEYFDQLHKVIEKPTGAIFYNSQIVPNPHALKLKSTDIQGDYLIYKKTESCILHLILANIRGGSTIRLIPTCFFVRKLENSNADIFLQKQKEFQVLSSKKLKKI